MLMVFIYYKTKKFHQRYTASEYREVPVWCSLSNKLKLIETENNNQRRAKFTLYVLVF